MTIYDFMDRHWFLTLAKLLAMAQDAEAKALDRYRAAQSMDE